MSEPKFTNRLADEKSPYLLQHAHNPVDWRPWSDAAWAEAKTQNRPVFLSIGYSTCHWCHVMEKECFEDIEVAGVLNSLYIPIKVDREERPDVDRVYMTFCQAMTGGGGWPLNLICTPAGEPFFAGTYIPRDARGEHPGLTGLLRNAATVWKNEGPKVSRSSRNMVISLQKRMENLPVPEPHALVREVLDQGAEQLAEQFDADHGGFGPAPKFPTPQNITLLLRRHRRTKNRQFLEMATATLDAMRRGGIHDQLGGGFHRYATDAEWRTPHFEKMLYDQAALTVAYTEGFQATGDARYAATARATLNYVLRDLSDQLGGFTCGEDADSEGTEGLYYVWAKAEVMELLGPALGARFCAAHGISETGNYRDEATGEPTGTNILHLSANADAEDFSKARTTLLSRRQSRVRPHHDDKVLAGWNGLMLTALAKAGHALNEPVYIERAERCADFLFSHLWRDGKLLRRYRENESAGTGFAEDYAFVGRGLVDLFEATGKTTHLKRALELARRLWDRFGGEEGRGLTDIGDDGEALVLTTREVYDGPTPSANSAGLELFARLWLLTGDPVWQERARSLLIAFSQTVRQFPAAYGHFLQGAALLLEPTRQLVITGALDQETTRELLREAASTYAPELSIIFNNLDEKKDNLLEVIPFLESMSDETQSMAQLCEGFACRIPMSDPKALRAALREPPPFD